MATFSATAEPVDGRVRLNLDWSDEPTVVSATISRADPDGRTRPVRNAEPAILSTGVALVYDHEAPFNEAVTYTATSANSANQLAAGPATVTSARVWLKHPLLPTLNKPVTIHTAPELGYPARRTLHRVLGRADPVAVTDMRHTGSGTVALLALTAVDTDALVSLFEDGSVLLLAGVPEFHIGNWFIAAGDVTFAKPFRMVQDPVRVVTVPFDIVERPAGNAGGAAANSYAEVLAVYATYAAVIAGEATYLDLLSGVRTLDLGGEPDPPPPDVDEFWLDDVGAAADVALFGVTAAGVAYYDTVAVTFGQQAPIAAAADAVYLTK